MSNDMSSMTATRTRRPAAAKAAPVKQDNQRLSCGSVWATSNAGFLAGNLTPSKGQYRNQQDLLDLLPEAPEGFHWRIKMYANRSSSEHAPDWDITLELEEIYQR